MSDTRKRCGRDRRSGRERRCLGVEPVAAPYGGLSKLAKAAGISPGHLSMIVGRRAAPSAAVAERLEAHSEAALGFRVEAKHWRYCRVSQHPFFRGAPRASQRMVAEARAVRDMEEGMNVQP